MTVSRKTNARSSFFTAAFCLAAILSFVPAIAQAHTHVLDKRTSGRGLYNVKLEIAPARSFKSRKHKIVRDGGASLVHLHGRHYPNHDMVVFLKRHGRPVEHADVGILYRRLWPHAQRAWQMLPVARMHEAGRSLATTRFGNNARMASGRYDVQVSVNGSWPAIFYVTLHG